MSDAPAADDLEELLGPAHDFAGPTAPKLVYMLVDSPQCEGDMLSRQLWRTGVLGAPMTYFGPDREIFLLASRLKAESFRDLFTKIVQRRTSPNGVFGFRMRRPDFRLLDVAGMLTLARRMRVVYIDRRDDVAQAVEMARGPGGALAGGPYGFEPIAETLQGIRASREAWRRNFREIGVRPIGVDHALLRADPARAVATVAGALGVDLSQGQQVAVPALPVHVADAEEEAWTARFKSEAVLRGIAIGPAGQPSAPAAATGAVQ